MASQYSARLGVLLSLNTAEFSKSVDAAIQENRKLKSAMQREMKAAAKEVQALEYAVKDYGREVTHVEKMQRNFAEGGKFQQLGKASEDFRSKMLAQAAAMDVQVNKFKTGQKALASGFQMTAQQMAALGYQSTDIVTGLISGQSPFMVLIQQGGQLRDQFGSFGNVFRGFASVITVARVATLGLVGGIATLGYALIKASADESKFNDALILSNNTLGLTHDSLSTTATEIADHFGTNVGEAKEALIELSASGTLSRDQLADVGVMVARVAQLSGKTASVVAKELAPSLDGSAKGAEELNKKYHFLTLAEYKRIETLEKLGRKQEALRIITEKFTKVQETHKRDIGYIQSAWEGVTNALSKYLGLLMELGTMASEMRGLRSEIARLEKEMPFTQGGSKDRKQARINQLKEELAAMEAANKKAEAAGDPQRAEDKKIERLEDARALAKAKRDLNDETYRINAAAALADREAVATDLQLINMREAQRSYEIAVKYDNMIADDRLATGGRLAKQIEEQRAAASTASKEKALLEIAEHNRKIHQLDLDSLELRQDTEFEAKKATATELEAIDLEAEQRAAKAWFDRDRKNAEERGSFAEQRERELSDKLAAIRSSAETKKALISRQAALEIENEQKGRLNNIELQRAEIQLYAENLLAGEKDIAILKAKLAYTQEIAKIEANTKLSPDARDEAKARAGKIKDSSIAMAREADNLKYLQDMNAAVFRNMEGAIMNFVKTGKLNFKDLTRSIIADLMAIYIKAQILKVIGMVFPSISVASIAGAKADGGPVTGGSNYLVGEKGPEMFVPSSSGTIIPNHKLSNDDASGQQIIYNGPYIASMSAIDTQSATQFLAKNKSAVWAANQSAQRSIPVSR